VYSCPGPALFCLPIDTAPTWHLLPLPVASPLWFRPLVGLFGPGSAGWETVGRMGWFCAFLSSERPFGHAHAGSPSAYSSRGSRLPAVFASSPPLWFTQLVLGVSSHALLASCRVLDFLWPPRGMPENLNFAPSTLAFGLVLVWCTAARWDWFDPRSGGERMQPLQLCLPPS